MFQNIGGKIKLVVKFFCWIGIITSIILGIVIMNGRSEFAGIMGAVVAIVGSLLSWLGSILIYGFGQLVENSDILVARNTNRSTSANTATGTTPTPTRLNTGYKKCSGCGNLMLGNTCPNCGKSSKEIKDKLATLEKWKEEGIITEEEYKQKVDSLK